jgi:hypothetical protein
MDDELLTFVREALARGRSRGEIAEVLQRAGWSREQLTTALDAFADVEFAVPVPMPRPYLSARDAFLYLVLFTALYVTAYHLGSLVFDLINLAFPDRAMDPAYTHYVRSGMRWSVASLIVAFPVFMFMTRFVGREIARDPGKHRSKIRRWLIYLTLFVAACVLIADVTTLVYNALGGELTIRFGLKVMTVALIAGGVFGYYLQDLRADEVDRPASGIRARRLITAAAPLAVVAAVVTGLVAFGSPGELRKARLDERRTEHLQTISHSVDFYWNKWHKLPASLADLAGEPGIAPMPTDPATRNAYEYQASGEMYVLCAVFDGTSTAGDSGYWWHGAGRHCFNLTPNLTPNRTPRERGRGSSLVPRPSVPGGAGQRSMQIARDRRGDFRLHGENVAERTIVGMRPEVLVGVRFDELRRHAQAIALSDNRSFNDQVHAELAGDFRQRLPLTLVVHRRRPRDDAERIDAGEICDERFRQTVSEVVVPRVRGEILQRQYGE